MKTITIITPANIEVEYRLAGAGSRMAAFLIDFAVQVLLIIAAALVIFFGIDRGIFGNSSPSGTALGAFMVFVFVVQFGYFIVLELAMNGQSLGKRIFGLRVIRENGRPVEFTQTLIRGLLRTSLDMMYVGIFVILFSKKHKRLGDMAAGTVVVSEHYETREHLAPETSYWPGFLPDPFLLSPEERALAQEWLARRDDMDDGGGASGDAMVEYFRKKFPKENEADI